MNFLPKHKLSARISEWPFVKALFENDFFGSLELELILEAKKLYSKLSEKMALAIGFVSLAEKQGHLLIQYEKDSLFPPSRVLGELQERDDSLSFEKIDLAVTNGIKALEELFQNLPTEEKEASFILAEKKKLYLKKNWKEEKEIVYQLKRILSQKPTLKLNLDVFQALLSQKQSLNLFDEVQAKAINSIIHHSLGLLTGGPGTGKTYTAAHALDLFFNSLSDDGKQNLDAAIAAPTGKAASHFLAGLKKIVKDDWIEKADCGTLHALLGQENQFEESKEGWLPKDLVLIDEASMIDSHLLLRLLKAMKAGSRLILIGDKHQLPPVDAGSLFGDFLDGFNKHVFFQTIISELKKGKRQETESLSLFGEAILKEDVETALSYLKNDENLEWIEWGEKGKNSDLIKSILHENFNFLLEEEVSLDFLFSHLKRFCALTPLRKGLFGVEHLNSFFLKEIKKLNKKETLVLPIMITKNKASLQLFNGEIGFLFCKDPFQLQKGDRAYFHTKPQEFKEIPALLLPEFDLAFSFTIHKSQGSEFEKVLILFGEEGANFGKEILYTAVTRAKRKLTLFSTEETLKKCVAFSGRRLSGLQERILDL